jgi:uncharacterized protein YciI
MLNIFVIILNYVKPLEEVERHLVSHRSYLDKHYASGIFVASGRQQPVTGGVIIARSCDSSGKIITRGDIEKIMNNDPFIINKVSEYKIAEFTPIKHSEDFKKIIEA